MPKLPLSFPRMRESINNQKGLAHILVIFILLTGIVAGVYLVQHRQIFKSKADEGENYAQWVTQMQAFGVYPAKDENGDIILYDRKTFVEKYCQPQGCYLNPPTLEELTDAVKKDANFIHTLGDKLRENDFAPIQALESYFPDIKEMDDRSLGGALQALEPICRGGVEPICVPDLKTYISKEELTKIINQVATEKGLEEKDPIKNIINFSDPIFGTRSLVNVITLPPNQVSDSDRVNALLGLTVIYGLTEKVAAKGLQLTATTFVDTTKMIKDINPFRKSILAGEPMQLDAIGNAAPKWLIQRTAPIRPNSVAARAEAWSAKRGVLPEPQLRPGSYGIREGPLPTPKFSYALDEFNRNIKPAIEAGRGALISRTDVLRPVGNNVKNAIASFEARTGRKLPLQSEVLDRAIEDGTMYLVGDQFVLTGAGYTYGDMIVLGYERYFSLRGLGSIHHEMFHMLGGGIQKAVGWRYGGQMEKDKILTALYELMTDAWADIAMGQRVMSAGSHIATGGYAATNPHIIDALFNRLFRNNPQLLDDFLEFAITGDGNALASKFGGFDQLLAYFRQKGVNFNAISYNAAAIAALAENIDIITDPIVDINSDFLNEENLLNCSYSEDGPNCPSGFTVCTGHTDGAQCADKLPEECFNLVQCNYDTNLGSSCACSN